MRRLASALCLLLLASCGGKVSGEPSGSAASSVPRTAGPKNSDADESDVVDEAGPTGAEDGEWGTWQLLSVEGSNGERQYDPPFVELDLHSNGTAYLWTCSAGTTGTGTRCPFYARMNCFVGKIQSSGEVWRVEFPTKQGTHTSARGEIFEEPSGDITVKGEGALHPAGHYRRVGAASVEGCVP